MRMYRTEIRKNPNKEIRPTRSPLRPFTVELNSNLLQLKGSMAILTRMCTQLQMHNAKESIEYIGGQIEKMLREDYELEKRALIHKGLYPKDGMFDQRKIDRMKRKIENDI